MTQTQISTCLASIGLREDTYSTLDKVSSINLYNDASIYPSNGYEYYFDSSKNLLLEYSVKNEETSTHCGCRTADGGAHMGTKQRFAPNATQMERRV